MVATTLKQSRKLVELGIDSSTADMHYAFPIIGGAAFKDIIDNSAMLLVGNTNKKYPYEPAWSLSALLDVIRNNGRYELQMYEGGYYLEANGFMTESYFNPVDACVEMIKKLNELKLL